MKRLQVIELDSLTYMRKPASIVRNQLRERRLAGLFGLTYKAIQGPESL